MKPVYVQAATGYQKGGNEVHPVKSQQQSYGVCHV